MDIQRIQNISNYGASWILWILVGASVIALAVVLERAYVFWSSWDSPLRLRRELQELLAARDEAGARKRLRASRSFEAAIACAGLAADGAASAEECILAEREAARLKLERNLGFLGTLGSNAPFVGLLGTVIGIVRSFQRLGESAGQVSAGLMAEVGEALVATAIGILVALPAIAFFNLFHRSIKSRLGHAEVLGRDVLAYLKSTASQLEASRRATLSAE